MNKHHKTKNKKSALNQKPKTVKKHKNKGPSCSMFLAEITKRLVSKKRQDEEKEVHRNIIQTIIDSITNALPIKFLKNSPIEIPSPMQIETLQTFAPELLPNNTLEIPPVIIDNDDDNENTSISERETTLQKANTFKVPKMPLVNSDVFKMVIEENKLNKPMQDEAVNTKSDHDLASALAKHVKTLKKISLIAEEFNQKTAKNLKEIVDSVQDDLIKKLEMIQSEQNTNSEKSINIEEKPSY